MLRIVGAGAGKTTFDCQNNAGWAQSNVATSASVFISNLSVVGNCDNIVALSNTQSGVWTISNVNFANSANRAISFNRVRSLIVSSSNVTGCNSEGITVNGQSVGSAVSISNSVISSNGATGVSLSNSVVAIISDCTFSANNINNPNNNGGAFFASFSSIMLTSNLFTGNSANAGAGIYITSSQVTATGNTFTSNTIGSTNGGAAYLSSVNGQLSDSSFTANAAFIPLSSTPVGGGAIYVTGLNNLFLRNLVFARNSAYSGGAIAIDRSASTSGSVVNLQDSTFTNNTAADAGGAVDMWLSAQVNARNCVFRGNTALQGGAIRVEAISDTPTVPTFNNCSFYDNFASGVSAVHQGGAITTTEALKLSDCVFVNNTAFGHGGAVASIADVTTSDSKFFLNKAGGNGGALYAALSSSSVKLTTTVFTQNTAQEGGGVWCGARLTVTTSSFAGNAATTSNGGALSTYSDSTVMLSTFSSNSATNGGAIHVGSSISIQQSNFTSNAAVTAGGAVHCFADPAAPVAGTMSISDDTFSSNSAAVRITLPVLNA